MALMLLAMSITVERLSIVPSYTMHTRDKAEEDGPFVSYSFVGQWQF